MYILSIGGLDPSSGAGITSDIKTFEAHGVYGLSICTGITIQNDIKLKDILWIDKKTIFHQIEILFERFKINIVKIGMIPSWAILSTILDELKKWNEKIKIILDPILKSSSGFDFHPNEDQMPEEILRKCYLITPNSEEMKILFPEKKKKAIACITQFTNLYLKGGHREHKKGWDELYYDKTKKLIIPPKIERKTEEKLEKHGSGCILSSSLASHLALGNPLEMASKKAKYYTEQFLNSNDSLLGHHKMLTKI